MKAYFQLWTGKNINCEQGPPIGIFKTYIIALDDDYYKFNFIVDYISMPKYNYLCYDILALKYIKIMH